MLNDQSITSPHNEPQGPPGFVRFVSPQNTITNSGGEFGLDETSTECKVSIFFKRNNFIQSNAGKKFACKLKKFL